MGLSHLLTTFLPLFATFPTDVSGPILFNLYRGETEKAFENYLSYVKEERAHDFSLLQRAAKTLLEQGIHSKDPEIQLMCIFGAGIATSSDLLSILEKGIHSDELKTQLVALSYLGKQQDDEADKILLDALSSPFLIVRLEALLHLAKKNHPAVLSHLSALALKVPDVVRTVFGQIAVHLDGPEAFRYVHKLLNDQDVDVRTETILAVASANRDDFLPSIHILANGTSFSQQEAAALALGEFKDYSALPRLKILAESKQENVKLAAHIALYELGEWDALHEIEKAAQNHSLFAINALGNLKEGKEILYQLLLEKERDVRLNAILALLNHQDPRVLNYLDEILGCEGKDVGFWRLSSAGGGLHAWKTIPSASQQKKIYPGVKAQTMNLCEKVLTQCIEFDEENFLKIAHVIFSKKQNALVPLLVELLENRKSEGVIQFLKDGQQKAGAPLIRNYCTLALYRLKIDGSYEEQLVSWVKECGREELIRFREEDTDSPLCSTHKLTPEETSRFLVEACQTLASALNETGIEVLIHTIAYGNPKNRYALAGLLLRTTE